MCSLWAILVNSQKVVLVYKQLGKLYGGMNQHSCIVRVKVVVSVNCESKRERERERERDKERQRETKRDKER